VGTRVEIDHLAPSLLGMAVELRARARHRPVSLQTCAWPHPVSSRARAWRGRGISADRCAGDSSPSARNDKRG
jgi:hypothetical protein